MQRSLDVAFSFESCYLVLIFLLLYPRNCKTLNSLIWAGVPKKMLTRSFSYRIHNTE